NRDGTGVYLKSSIGRDTAAIVEKNLDSGAEKVLSSSSEGDAEDTLIDPKSHVVQAVAYAPGRTSWTVLDPSVEADFDGIAKLADADVTVVSRTNADDAWLVAFDSDKGGVTYYRWDRTAKKGTFLLAQRPKLQNMTLAAMKPVAIKSRDGLTLHG